VSEVRDIWDQAAHLYDQIYANNVPYHRSHDVVADLLPATRAVHVLDLGAGTGLMAQRILERLPKSRVTCIDFSPKMIEECRRRLEPYRSRAGFVCDDITRWDPKRRYEAVVACNTLVYKEIDIGECYAKYASVLAAGGVMLNSTVVEHDAPPALHGLLEGLCAPGAPAPSPELVEFAKGAGRKIAHFGEGSLAVAYPVEEHLSLVSEAGLEAGCPWRYLSQAVILGVKAD
jgi:SAM-dependent methyltransferase